MYAGSCLIKTEYNELGPATRGKVRDIYDLGEYLLVVATDRISAQDVNLPNPIPGKGEVLTKMSVFWLEEMAGIIPDHLITANVIEYPDELHPYLRELEGRSMLVKKAEPLPVECVVRGYLSGSGWSAYRQGKPICGITLPLGLLESSKLPEPIFTPTTKAESGHDQPITFEELVDLVGYEMAINLRDVSLRLYHNGAWLALKAGIIIADTKFEFGLYDGKLMLIDELLTPDSSRFWPLDDYKEGRPQKSFDKQPLRDYLISIGWNGQLPAPELPEEVVEMTAEKYQEALRRITGRM